MPTDTFQIGNGKTAKVGDKVWSGVYHRPRQCVVFAMGDGGNLICDGGRALLRPDQIFATLEEAEQAIIKWALSLARKAVGECQRELNEARHEVARLESMLASEGDGAKGSAA